MQQVSYDFGLDLASSGTPVHPLFSAPQQDLYRHGSQQHGNTEELGLVSFQGGQATGILNETGSATAPIARPPYAI
jgi:hypothetical protein